MIDADTEFVDVRRRSDVCLYLSEKTENSFFYKTLKRVLDLIKI